MSFSYEIFKREADIYVMSKYDSLDVLKSYNVPLREELHKHMHKVVAQYNQDKDAKSIIKINNDMIKQYINEYMEM